MSGPQRVLVALGGGPKDGHWYWLDDWDRQCQATRAQGLTPGDPGGAVLCYQPTDRHVDNANPRYGHGQVWQYVAPATPTPGDSVPTSGAPGGPVVCPTCQRRAPRLLTWRVAGQPVPTGACPRCVYPDHLYLASREPTMPAADQAWYAAHPRPAGPVISGTGPTECAGCGQRLLLRRPGRERCARCQPTLIRMGTEPATPPAEQVRLPTGRVLVTGSRTWTNVSTIRAVLMRVRECYPAAVLLVHGDAVGADRIAAGVWDSWGLPTEAHPADWHRHGKAAGLLRNQVMVAAGAVVCVAFIANHSRGATHCAGLAERAGIPTWRHEAVAA